MSQATDLKKFAELQELSRSATRYRAVIVEQNFVVEAAKDKLAEASRATRELEDELFEIEQLITDIVKGL